METYLLITYFVFYQTLKKYILYRHSSVCHGLVVYYIVSEKPVHFYGFNEILTFYLSPAITTIGRRLDEGLSRFQVNQLFHILDFGL